MVEPGDIILTSSNNIFVKAMKVLQSDPVNWGHALIVAEEGNAYSFSYSMEYVNLDKYMKDEKRKKYIAFRYKHMTQDKLTFMLRAMEKLKGIEYGWGRLILMLLDNIFGTRFFSKLSNNNRWQVCSSSVAWAYYVAFKMKFNGVDWRSVDPDDIEDHCRNSKDWVLITEV